MAVIENKIFETTYNKSINKLKKTIDYYMGRLKYGGNIDYNKIRNVIVIYEYLKYIDESYYDYYYINNLTNISNELNKI